jgi:hypothetical protein
LCEKLIGAEGARLLRDIEVTGDPAGALSAEEAPGPPRGKRAPGAEINHSFWGLIATKFRKTAKNYDYNSKYEGGF